MGDNSLRTNADPIDIWVQGDLDRRWNRNWNLFLEEANGNENRLDEFAVDEDQMIEVNKNSNNLKNSVEINDASSTKRPAANDNTDSTSTMNRLAVNKISDHANRLTANSYTGTVNRSADNSYADYVTRSAGSSYADYVTRSAENSYADDSKKSSYGGNLKKSTDCREERCTTEDNLLGFGNSSEPSQTRIM